MLDIFCLVICYDNLQEHKFTSLFKFINLFNFSNLCLMISMARTLDRLRFLLKHVIKEDLITHNLYGQMQELECNNSSSLSGKTDT